jgi:hypothetical protein
VPAAFVDWRAARAYIAAKFDTICRALNDMLLH